MLTHVVVIDIIAKRATRVNDLDASLTDKEMCICIQEQTPQH